MLSLCHDPFPCSFSTYFCLFSHWALQIGEKLNKLQQKGLEDYKLATANASMNADFGMEEKGYDINHGLAAMSLDAADAEKSHIPAKEVWTLLFKIIMYYYI